MQMNKSANNQIDDEFLASILNKDMIVRIGDNLYRLNKPEEKVYVLPMQYITEYNDLVAQNMKNHHIKKFSTDDSVIEMVESGELGEKKAFCGEDGVGSRHQEVEQYNGSTGGSNTAITSLSHNKYGIYFTITIETSSREPLGSTFKYEFSDSQSERACKIKCSDWNYADQFMSSVYLTTYSKISLGNTSRNFSRYNEKVRVHLYKGYGFDQYVSTSDWIQIRANM
jgi:hypothetical protein